MSTAWVVLGALLWLALGYFVGYTHGAADRRR
jgi:hypothetical protein